MMRRENPPLKPPLDAGPLGEGSQCEPTLDDMLMVVLAAATVLGLLALIGLSSVSTASRLAAAISRLTM